MKILTIASILPVPGLIEDNNYILKHIKAHKLHDPSSDFLIVRPSSFIPSPVAIMAGKKWFARNRVAKILSYTVNGFKISVLGYYSIGSSEAIHSLLSSSIITINRDKLDFISAFKPDLIHAHYLFPDGLLANFLSSELKIPFILTLQEETRFFRSFISTNRALRILKKAAFITTLSPVMKSELDRYGFTDSKLLALGIHENFHKVPRQALSNSGIKFVTAANLVPVKNLASVIRALDKLKGHGDLTYTIIGDGPEKQKLIGLTKSLGLVEIVRFIPSIPNEDLAEELVKYDVYIQPSFKETFGLSYFEALACGLPVILTENTGAYHFIKDYNCYLTVDPYDVEDIAAKIRIACDHAWIATTSEDCKKAAGIASWDHFVREMAELYKNCMDDARK